MHRHLLGIAAFFSTMMPMPLLAHPHVWVTARAELLFDDQQRFVAVRNAWQFDEAFSAYALQGLDENGDGVYSREELSELADVNMESLKDFEYFTYVQMGAEDPKYSPPKEYWLKYDSGVLTLFFTLPMQKPVAADPNHGFRDLTVEVFDPTFFVDISFTQDKPILVAGAKDCQAHFQAAKKPDFFQSQLLSQIGPDEDIPADIAPAKGDLANTIRVNCGAS